MELLDFGRLTFEFRTPMFSLAALAWAEHGHPSKESWHDFLTSSHSPGPADVQAREAGRKMSAGVITGIVLGVLAGLAVITAVALIFRRYNRFYRTDRQYGPSLIADHDTDEL